MKKLIVALAALAFAGSVIAGEPAKKESVKKPELVAPATPKAMPKVEKPAKKNTKKVEEKPTK